MVSRMTSGPGTIVWIDQHEARIFDVAEGAFDETKVRASGRHVHRHPKGGTAEHNHPDDAQHFFHDVAAALEGATQILVVGPSTAKLHFLRFLHQHAAKLEAKVVGIETVDHPTDGQLVAHGKRHFGVPDPRV